MGLCGTIYKFGVEGASGWLEDGRKVCSLESSTVYGGGGPRVAWWRGVPHTGSVMRSPDFIRDRARELRRGMTAPERTLWYMLRRDALGLHFRRQHPVGPFILDFYCASAKLCVEVDGPAHDDAGDRDEHRTRWLLAKEGIRVLRFSVADIEQRPAQVVAAISQAAPPSTA
jgi:very-short-patch-repair endonuclease